MTSGKSTFRTPPGPHNEENPRLRQDNTYRMSNTTALFHGIDMKTLAGIMSVGWCGDGRVYLNN
jgi:hypothetical protein